MKQNKTSGEITLSQIDHGRFTVGDNVSSKLSFVKNLLLLSNKLKFHSVKIYTVKISDLQNIFLISYCYLNKA